MTIYTRIQKACSDKKFIIFFSVVTAFVLGASVTIDQQSKNLIKLLVVAGIFITIFNWKELQRHSKEFDKIAAFTLVLFFLSILTSIALNPLNNNTMHDIRVMSIGFTSIFIWNLLISIRFRADYFWWGIILCALSTGLYALYEIALHGIAHRAAGSSGKSIMFGDIAMISGVLSIAAKNHFKKYNLLLKYIPIIASILGISASIFSGSRGGWLFLPVAAVILLIHLRKSNTFYSLKNILLSITLLFIVVFLLINNTKFTDRIDEASKEVTSYITKYPDIDSRTSIGQRFEMWKAAIFAFKDSPYIGIGPGAFDDHLKKLAAEGVIHKHVSEALYRKQGQSPHTHAHNEYLNTLATRGLLGISAVILVFIFPLIRFVKAEKVDAPLQSDFGLAGIFLVTGYMVFSITESVLYHAMTANFYFLTLVSLLLLTRNELTQRLNPT